MSDYDQAYMDNLPTQEEVIEEAIRSRLTDILEEIEERIEELEWCRGDCDEWMGDDYIGYSNRILEAKAVKALIQKHIEQSPD